MKIRYEYQLLPLCESLHEECTGSGSGNLQFEQIVEYYEFLRARLKSWKPNCGNALRDQIEDAIRNLVSMVLVEASESYIDAKVYVEQDKVLKVQEKIKSK